MTTNCHLFDEYLTQAALPKRVVLEVEAVKAVEGLLACVHVQRVHIQVIPASFTYTNLTLHQIQASDTIVCKKSLRLHIETKHMVDDKTKSIRDSNKQEQLCSMQCSHGS